MWHVTLSGDQIQDGEDKNSQLSSESATSAFEPSPSSTVVQVKTDDDSRTPTAHNAITTSAAGTDIVKPEIHAQTEQEVLDQQWRDDPAHPLNWSRARKWRSAAVVSLYTFVEPASTSMMVPGLPDLAKRYHISSSAILALTMSIFLLSLAIGPLILAPLSEIYGRRWVLHWGILTLMAFNFGCAYAPSVGSLLALRFLAGFSASGPFSSGGGCIGDLFSTRDRGLAMAIYVLGPIIVPVIAPIAGGFITQAIGVKYVFIVMAGLCGVSALIGLPLLEETYAPVLRLKLYGPSADLEKQGLGLVAGQSDGKFEYLWEAMTRPIVLLSRSLICFMLSLYLAFISGIYFLMFATFSDLYMITYGFGPGLAGLANIGLGVGLVIATLFAAKFGDRVYLHLISKNGGKVVAEMRIPYMLFGALVVPIGLFWYGWTAHAKAHWILPIIGTAIYAFGVMTTYLPMQLYLVDTFQYAASAIAASLFFRSLLGFVFPLFGQGMYNSMGIGPANSLLGGLAVGLGIPFPVWLYFYGGKYRRGSPYTIKD